MKRCSACGIEKALTEFKRDSTHADGRASRCLMCTRAASKAQHRRNPQPARVRARKWRADHLVQAGARSTAWAKQNPERRKRISNRSATRAYHADIEAGRAKGRASMRRQRKARPAAMRLYLRHSSALRRARQKNNHGERVDYIEIMLRDRMRCHICRGGVMRSELHFDHVIPLVKDGAHAAHNIAVAHKSCNLRKHTTVLTLF